MALIRTEIHNSISVITGNPKNSEQGGNNRKCEPCIYKKGPDNISVHIDAVLINPGRMA